MRYLLWFLIVILCLIIIYLSWISSPRFAWNAYVPDWIAHWADKQENDNFRTAIPFIGLGFVSGFLMILSKVSQGWWFRCWLIHSLLIIIVEMGQLLRPLRSFDVMDIFWGMLGSGLSLFIMYKINEILQKLN